MDLADLTARLAARQNGTETQISGVTQHLNEVRKGMLFVCVEGKNTDGHLLAAKALEKGASGIVCSSDLGLEKQIVTADTRAALAQLAAAFYGYPSEEIYLIGVTGTNGKTTTTHWMRDLFSAVGKRASLIGTLGADTGTGAENTGYTTPDAVIMNRFLRESRQNGNEFAVAEVSSQALAQKRCEALSFRQAVFTNLSEDHLDYHGTMQEYAAAKASLFGMAQTAIINCDDPYADIMLRACKGRVQTCSVFSNADYFAQDISYKDGCVSYILVSGEDIARVKVLTPGLFSVYNSMTAIASCVEAGIDFYTACSLSSQMRPVQGRMQRVLLQMPFSVCVDFAHTPAALQASLQAMRTQTKGRLLLVFGCGGDRDREKRSLMGRVAASLADYTIVTDDNPRSEEAWKIRSRIISGFANKRCYTEIADRYEAIRYALRLAKAGDSVLIAGKGHEKMQIMADGQRFFDDVAAVLSICDAMQKD